MLISLTVVIISQYMHISDHHVVYLKYIQLKKISSENIGEFGEEGDPGFLFVFLVVTNSL